MGEYSPDQVKWMAKAIYEHPGSDGEYNRLEFVKNSCSRKVQEVLGVDFDNDLFSYVYNLMSDNSSQIQNLLEHGTLQIA
ncbi:hypothetical protein KKC44_01020 [Patescibacteria group bacterium]|nr:hypothetical protein [Patescibacteria group bacterium]MBU2259164.1 hypothetical protein [Patescibacteria group bacterium]